MNPLSNTPLTDALLKQLQQQIEQLREEQQLWFKNHIISHLEDIKRRVNNIEHIEEKTLPEVIDRIGKVEFILDKIENHLEDAGDSDEVFD